jgi:putative restriction endonuclease
VHLTAEQLGVSTSLIHLDRLVDGGRLSLDFWSLLQSPAVRETVRSHIYDRYFPGQQPADMDRQMIAATIYNAERLISEAKAKFVLRNAPGGDDNCEFIRHYMFPQVVRSLYHDSCALCGVDVRVTTGATIVDAAHIVPFATSHNDDPRNGIAFCKNHHWGFDAGWFGFTDDYKLIVSGTIERSQRYFQDGDSLNLPQDAALAPAIEALRWHREAQG